MKMISKRIVEAVILSHHLSEYDEPIMGYVDTKTLYEWASLDPKNMVPFNLIRDILRETFGIQISESAFEFTTEDVN